MTFATALAAVELHSNDPDALAELARSAVAEGEEGLALPVLARAARAASNARLWQWKGLLERSLGEHEQALESFSEASRLLPDDVSIAHGHARVALEAGSDAVQLFEHAWWLAPSDGSVLLGLMAARFAAGAGAQAESEMQAILAQQPLWIEGHVQLAQLRSMLGQKGSAASSLVEALKAHPHEPRLWKALFDMHVRADDFAGLSDAVERARRAGLGESLLLPFEAIAAAELGATSRADSLFKRIEIGGGPPLPLWKIRHLLRSGRASEALTLVDSALASTIALEVWPYAAVAWQITRDPRADWLFGDPRLVLVQDIASELAPIGRLAECLRSLHVAKGEFMDQSVRGGTQTDGPLLSRIEPEIRQLRGALAGAVRRYVEQLPPSDAKHPLLGRRRDRDVRFAGSWSVRLKAAGYHAAHVHPQGWISSACYVALPDAMGGEKKAGWLTLGRPPASLGIDIPPLFEIEPKEGQLVLFPSWMWHGTNPFSSGERLTVAFDVSVPD